MAEIRLSDHFTIKRLLRFTFPSILMMLVTSTYTVVDGFFVSNFTSKTSFAAVNLIWPVLQILGAFGQMFGAGGSAYLSFLLGTKDKKRANSVFSFIILFMSGLGVLFSVVGIILMPQISSLLGASDTMLADCVTYGRILASCMPFFFLQNAFSCLLVTAERPKMGLYISVAAGVTNMVFDFLLVYVFRLGVFGAAAATAFSWVVGGLIPTLYFLNPKNTSALRFGRIKADWKALCKVCTNGASEMVTNLSMSVVAILYNYQLMRIAGENGIAAYGVIAYVSFVFVAIFLGYSMGANPIFGYHYGADNRAELKNLLRISTLLITISAVIMFVLSELLAHPISAIYVGYDTELLNMTVTAMRIYGFSYLLCGFNIFGSAFFTGLGNGAVSATISFLRTFLFQTLAVLLLPILFDINGVWTAVLFAEGLTLIVTVSCVLANRKKYGYL